MLMHKQIQQTIRLLAVLLLACVSLNGYAERPNPGTLIVNQAVVTSNGNVVLRSNTVSFETSLAPTVAEIEFLQYANGQDGGVVTDASNTQCSDATGTFTPSPYPDGLNLLDSSSTAPALDQIDLLPVNSFAAGQPIFVSVVDPDRNIDTSVRDSIQVTVDVSLPNGQTDRETLILQENGVNSGQFVGLLQTRRSPPASATHFDCLLAVQENTQIAVTYSDPQGAGETVQADVLVDPLGVVFDSQTGAPIDGATVQLFATDSAGNITGPAEVFGDNADPGYPSSVVTGQSFTHAGITYSPPTGGFRFPLLAPGNYVLVVDPPNGYNAPSTRPIADLLADPDTQGFAIVVGSFGDVFEVVPGPALNIDIPIDPDPFQIRLSKTATRTSAGIGDFVQYRLVLENDAGETLTGTEIRDTLPVGFRYQAGSLVVDDVKVADPQIADDGRTMTIPVPDLALGQRVEVRYVVTITADAVAGDAANVAVVFANNAVLSDVQSNEAVAAIVVKRDFIRDQFHLIGRVIEGECGTPAEELIGVPNIRMLMEDGTYVATDRDGQFHFENISRGTHVVQMDLATLPSHMEVIPCIRNTQHAGRPFSRFVDVQSGSLWRTDFYVRPIPKAQGPVGIRLQSFAKQIQRFFTFRANFGIRKADDLTATDYAPLDEIVAELKGYDIDSIEITGHTSNVRIAPENRHEFADNYVLSLARANNIKSYLLGRLPLTEEQITTIGRGPDSPVADNSSERGRAANRRVELRVRASSPIRYQIDIDAGAVATDDVKVMLMAPKGINLRADSVLLDGKPFDGGRVGGTVAQFTLGDMGADWDRTIEILGAPKAPTYDSNIVFHAEFDTRKDILRDVSVAELDKIIAQFKGKTVERITVTGHTDNIRIAPEHRHEFANNYELSRARARTVARRLAEELALAEDQITIVGRGPNSPLATNDTAEGRQQNRRVELQLTVRKDGVSCTDTKYVAKAVGMFKSEFVKSGRTDVVENEHACEKTAPRVRQYMFTPRFETRKHALRAGDKLALDRIASRLKDKSIIALETVGHTDSIKIAKEHEHEYADNYVLGEARAREVGTYVAAKLNLDQRKLSTVSRAAEQPIESNDSAAGRQANRRVVINATASEMSAEGIAITVPDSGRKAKLIEGHTAETRPDRFKAVDQYVRRYQLPEEPEKLYDRDWTAGQEKGIGWVYPDEDSNSRIPAIYVAVKHFPRQKIELSINGAPVHVLNFSGLNKGVDRNVQVSVWRAVSLQDGPNTLTAVIKDRDGSVVERLTRDVHFSGSPIRAKLLKEESLLVADGVTRPVLAVQFTDRFGKPARPFTTGEFTVRPPYTSAQSEDLFAINGLAGTTQNTTNYIVQDNGIAYIELAPTTDSGAAIVDFRFGVDNSDEVRAWLEPEARDWILVGFAEGTIGFNNLSGNMSSLAANGSEDEIYTDGRAAVFAKGRIKGSWLMTLAYDTDRKHGLENGARLGGVVDPDEYYTLYGDLAQQRNDAASVEKLYLKIERSRFYAMFGDYSTNMSVTELGAYNRTFNGVKTEYSGDKLRVNAFASDTAHGYARDEIQGNGTSGLYRLTQDDILFNSDRVVIEVRDRFNLSNVIERRVLARHTDYNINYFDGTLFFREPVTSVTNFDRHPQFIVAEYETAGTAGRELNAGARAELHLLEESLRLGATMVHENDGQDEADLLAFDLKLDVTANTEITVEAATSEGENGAIAVDGTALVAKLMHRSERLDGQVYIRNQEAGFGLGQQNSSDSGIRKAGASLGLRVTKHLTIDGEISRQEFTNSDSSRDYARIDARYGSPGGGVLLGVQQTTDNRAGGITDKSQQLVVGANKNLFGDRVTLEARAETSLNDQDDSVDRPQRLSLGLSYKISTATSFTVSQEITQNDDYDSTGTRVGFVTRPWAGATVQTTVQEDQAENGPRSFAVLGLTQSLQLSERWQVDLSVDRTQTIRREGPTPLADEQPLTSGTLNNDFTAVSTGATYRADKWSWNGRVEARDSDTDRRLGFVTSFLKNQEAGQVFSTDARIFTHDSKFSNFNTIDADVDLSWADRRLNQRWSLLNRLELEYDREENGGSELTQTKIINNLSMNRVGGIGDFDPAHDYMQSRNQAHQWNVYWGTKYVIDNFDGVEFDGWHNLIGAEWRWDINQKLDLGLHGSVLHSWNDQSMAYSFGPSVGISPLTNFWITVGYNLKGFRDEDFDAAAYTESGLYLKLRIKFDQLTRLAGGGQHRQVRQWDEEESEDQYWRGMEAKLEEETAIEGDVE